MLCTMTINFKNEHTIFENYIKCNIHENEFHLSYNPSLQVNRGILKSITEIPEFSPYVTTIGLYNDQGDLLMVAKLSTPLKLSKDIETTLLIRYDL